MKVCPGCGLQDEHDLFARQEPEVKDWWCTPCLRKPISAALDELAKTRPQRPAWSNGAAS